MKLLNIETLEFSFKYTTEVDKKFNRKGKETTLQIIIQCVKVVINLQENKWVRTVDFQKDTDKCIHVVRHT